MSKLKKKNIVRQCVVNVEKINLVRVQDLRSRVVTDVISEVVWNSYEGQVQGF